MIKVNVQYFVLLLVLINIYNSEKEAVTNYTWKLSD